MGDKGKGIPAQTATGEAGKASTRVFAGYRSVALLAGIAGVLLTLLFFLASPSSAQSGDQVSFGADELSGGPNINNPTSLQFGPDGRLYVSQQDGVIYALDVTRNGPNDYQVTNSETINSVKALPNHNDDGSYNSNVNKRQVTGILTAGTADQPVLYVTSSDPRIGGGGSGDDTNLDTNSGVLSRLTQTGSGWDHEMLVRGLPRSEENHSSNGLDIQNGTLYIAQGGHTNKGAPSNNFAYTAEYALAAAILEVDLGQIAGMSEKDAANTDVPYLYDLPTLAGTDTPFGGQNGQNMAKLVENDPVGIYSSGYRNSYDVTVTADGQVYTFDNGPNGGWGGQPVGDGTPDCTNEPNEGNSYSTADNLHLATEGSYGGHANPTRGNPEGAGLYDANGDQIGSVAEAVYDGYDNPAECDYQDPSEDSSLTTIGSSTNGLDEYAASNFDGAMQGDLLTAAFDGNVYRVQLNGAGDEVTGKSQQFSAGLSTPLDVTAQGDDQKFGGTVWVADFGGDDINVFEPSDSGGDGGGDTSCDASDPNGDADSDGYANGDEQSAGSDPCSAASTPGDYDDDNVSNANDPDDDNDNIDDTADPFAVDPDNGLSTNLPVRYDFSRASQPDSLEGIGFTGLMVNGEDYQDLYIPGDAIFGGANPAYTQEVIKNGDAYQNNNTQQHAFQFGVAAPDEPFVVHSDVTGYPENPKNFQSAGIQIGPGDQDNYLKLVLQANGGTGGLEMVKEVGGKATKVAQPDDPSVTGEGTVTDLYLTVDPADNTVVGEYTVNGGERKTVGETGIPAGWIDNSDQGLAAGVVSTSFNASEFSATWNDFEVVAANTGGNQAPTAEAGPNKTVDENNEVQLDGSSSNDPEGEQLGYSWTQTGGPDGGSLSSQDSPTPTFNAPEVDGDTTFTFELTVSDGEKSDSDTVDVLVQDTDAGSGGETGGGETGEIVFATNSGGGQYTAQNGTVYQADTGFNGGQTYSVSEAIEGTENDPLYQTERYGDFSYDVPLESGTYEVTLKFAELYHGVANGDSNKNEDQTGDRLFDVSIEGDQALNDYDIYEQAGGSSLTAVDETFTGEVTDGELNVEFTTEVDNAKVSAIKVSKVDGSGGDGGGGDGGDGGEQTAGAGFTVNGGNGNIDASTFNSGSFEITNTGDKQISSVAYDLSPVTLPDIVFDPQGTAGDSGSKGFTPDSGGDQTGLQDGEFSAPQNGQNGDDGYNALTATFDDFGNGESFAFSADIDPTSIKNAQGTGEAGSVSGLELSGATVTVEYADGSTQTTSLFGDGSQGGSEAGAQADDPAAPTLGAQGVELDESALDEQHSAATVSEAGQTITVSGPAGATVELLRIEGQLVLANQADGYEVEEYEANTAEQVEYGTVKLDGNGEATVDVTLTNTTTDGAEGGFNYFIAAAQDGNDGSGETGATSNTVILKLQESEQPPPEASDDGSLPALYRADTGEWFLREALAGGEADTKFRFGGENGVPKDATALMGDWDGDGEKSPGFYKNGKFYLKNSNSGGEPDLEFRYGSRSGDKPVVGDWDGDGTDTVGVVRGNRWLLNNENASGEADIEFRYGKPSDEAIVGDWDGDGTDTAGLVRGNRWLLNNENAGGKADIEFRYGKPSDEAIVGDWDGDGKDTAGVVRGNRWLLTNGTTGGRADEVFRYGKPSDDHLVWRASAS